MSIRDLFRKMGSKGKESWEPLPLRTIYPSERAHPLRKFVSRRKHDWKERCWWGSYAARTRRRFDQFMRRYHK